ncbi:hypothetical protein VTJ04DRAFT_4080 [Mycothermus thermophilus]|uniref:uncharacterized protein n=1 Tax=Humicola insolens TaxID=85995 RepID=UPI003743B62E
MDRSRDPKVADNLLERKNILIAQIMAAFRDIVYIGTSPIDNNASTGQTAYSSMALQTVMSQIIHSAEDLLSLTRQIRELWVIGPLKPPAAHIGGSSSEAAMAQDAQSVIAMLDALRHHQRQSLVREGNGFTYVQGDIDGPGEIPKRSLANQSQVPGDEGTPGGVGGSVVSTPAAAGPASSEPGLQQQQS